MRRSFVFAVLCLAACADTVGVGDPGGGAGGAGGSVGAGGGGGAATGGGSATAGGSGGSAGTGTLPCDVGAILQGTCSECHQSPPLFGAPMPLLTWADTHADSAQFPGQKIYQRMAVRVTATTSPMPQPPRTLTQQQISTITAWAAAGAPVGAGTCGAGGGGGSGGGGASAGGAGGNGGSGGAAGSGCAANETRIDVTAPMFAFPQQSDFYQCFAKTISLPAKRHAMKIDKVIDDAQVLHHVVLFRDTGKNSPAQIPNCGFQADWQALYAWAPGAGPMVPPTGVGIPINDGDQLVIQIHYNNPTSLVGHDSSGAYLCVTDQLQPNEAGVLAIGPTQLSLPPNCPATSAQGTCTNVLGTTYNVFTVWPHMHRMGRAMTTTLQHSGAADVVVTNRPNYDFNSQYLEAMTFQFRSGDTLVNRCTWNTSGATGTVHWGEATSDEMCFNFLYLYPVPPVAFCPSPNPPASGCP
jgi:hypothetical protein